MSVQLPDEVQKFEAHIKKSFEGVVFELTVTHNLLVKKVIELTWFIAATASEASAQPSCETFANLRIAMRRRSVLNPRQSAITCHNVSRQARSILQAVRICCG
jgi:hypothetical protein